jgi:hypothetical protein
MVSFFSTSSSRKRLERVFIKDFLGQAEQSEAKKDGIGGSIAK